jgi:hypothetical protein
MRERYQLVKLKMQCSDPVYPYTNFHQMRLHMMAHRPIGYLGDEVQRFSHYGKHQRLHLRSVKLITDGVFVILEVPGQHAK